jgi:hypothetical protein
MKVYYQNPDNSTLWVNIPFDLKELTFEQFCDFKSSEVAFWDAAQRGLDPEQGESPIHPYTHLQKAIEAVMPGTIDTPYNIDGDRLQELLDTGYQVNIGDSLSLIRLYAHFINLVGSYQPDKIPTTFILKHKGKDFVLQEGPTARLLSGISFTSGEALEVLEYMRRKQEAIKENPAQEGNIDFELGLTEFAILVRQKGEKLPHSRPKLEKFIRKRRELFKDLPLDKILAIRFFFLNTLLKLGTLPTTSHFGRMFLAATGGQVVARRPERPGKNVLRLQS